AAPDESSSSPQAASARASATATMATADHFRSVLMPGPFCRSGDPAASPWCGIVLSRHLLTTDIRPRFYPSHGAPVNGHGGGDDEPRGGGHPGRDGRPGRAADRERHAVG